MAEVWAFVGRDAYSWDNTNKSWVQAAKGRARAKKVLGKTTPSMKKGKK